MNTRLILYGALAGALGGAVGWLPGEGVAAVRASNASVQSLVTAAYFVLIGGGIGGALGGLDGWLNRARARLIVGGRTGALLGALGGAVGGLIGQVAFQALSGIGLGLLGRAIGWGLVGVFIGLSQGVRSHDRAWLWRGAIGGLLGGYLGGGAFEMISLILGQGTLSRFIADVLLGAFIGALITFVVTWLSEAWLVVVSAGKQEGRRVELKKGETTLGRGDRNDFVLFASTDRVAQHAAVIRKPDGYWLRPTAPASIDGQPVAGEQRLRNKNRIAIGGMTLLFSEQTPTCPKCGAGVRAGARFCPVCRAPLGKV